MSGLKDLKLNKENISDDLARKFEFQEAESWADYFADCPGELENQLGIRTVRAGGSYAISAAKVDILAYNRVIGLGIHRPVDEEQITGMINFYRSNGTKRFFVQLSPAAQPDNVKELLEHHHFYHYNNWTKLFRPVTGIPPVDTPLKIEQISREQSGIFSDIIIQAFEWPEILKKLIANPVGRPGWKHYVAFKGNTPAACASLFIRGEIATLALAATRPDYRGLGGQSALIIRRIQDVSEAGCKWIISETAEENPEKPVPSYRNLLKTGFQVAYKRPNFIWENNS
jgi:GNAT superfamily N-acetyltransferase